MPRCKDKPSKIDPAVWVEVQRIRANARTPEAKAAAKIARQAEKAKVKAKVERDKKAKDERDKIKPKTTGRVR